MLETRLLAVSQILIGYGRRFQPQFSLRATMRRDQVNLGGILQKGANRHGHLNRLRKIAGKASWTGYLYFRKGIGQLHAGLEVSQR